MNLGKLAAAHIIFWVLSTYPLVVQAETLYEQTVQYALEHLTSGISTFSEIAGTQVPVMPIRTWKSVTGHYCRKYEISVTKPGSDSDHGEWTRCRDNDGIWKKINTN